MQRIRMLQTKFGSPDGIQVYQYQAGQVYTVPDELANIFLSQGWAVEDKTLDGKIETKEIKIETGAVNIQTNVRPRKKK